MFSKSQTHSHGSVHTTGEAAVSSTHVQTPTAYLEFLPGRYHDSEMTAIRVLSGTVVGTFLRSEEKC